MQVTRISRVAKAIETRAMSKEMPKERARKEARISKPRGFGTRATARAAPRVTRGMERARARRASSRTSTCDVRGKPETSANVM